MSSNVNVLFLVGLLSDSPAINSLKDSFHNAISTILNKHSSHTELCSILATFFDRFKLGDSNTWNIDQERVHAKILVLPTIEQFRNSLLETFQSLIKDGTSTEENDFVHIVYSGQILEPQGEWLLKDSSLSEAHLVKWLDGVSNKSHEAFFNQLIQQHVNTPIKLHLFTSHVGDSSEWPFAKAKTPSSHGLVENYQVVIHRYRVPLSLHVHGTLKAHGKSIALVDCKVPEVSQLVIQFCERILHPIRTQTAYKTDEKLNFTKAQLESSLQNLGKMFVRCARPELYVFPVGDSSTHGCSALFNFDGFNLILGAPYVTEMEDPIFWPLVSAFERIDAFVMPDWSARAIFFERFMATLQSSVTFNRLGPLVVCPGEPTSLTSLGIVPRASSSHSHTWAQNAPTDMVTLPKFQLFHKIGYGDLSLQPLAQRSGLLLIWRSHQLLLRFLMPGDQVLPCGGSPQTALIRLYKTMLACGQSCGILAANPFAVLEKRASTTTTTSNRKAAPAQTARPATTKPAVPRAAPAAERPKTAAAPAAERPKTAAAPARPSTAASRPLTAKPAAPTRTAAKPAPKPAVPTPAKKMPLEPAKKAVAAAKPKELAQKQATTTAAPVPVKTQNGTTKPFEQQLKKAQEPKKEAAKSPQEEKILTPIVAAAAVSADRMVVTSDLIPDTLLASPKREINGLSADLMPDMAVPHDSQTQIIPPSQEPVVCEKQTIEELHQQLISEPVFCDEQTIEAQQPMSEPVYCDKQAMEVQQPMSEPFFCDKHAIEVQQPMSEPVYCDEQAMEVQQPMSEPVFCDKQAIEVQQPMSEPFFCDKQTIEMQQPISEPFFCDKQVMEVQQPISEPVFCDKQTIEMQQPISEPGPEFAKKPIIEGQLPINNYKIYEEENSITNGGGLAGDAPGTPVSPAPSVDSLNSEASVNSVVNQKVLTPEALEKELNENRNVSPTNPFANDNNNHNEAIKESFTDLVQTGDSLLDSVKSADYFSMVDTTPETTPQKPPQMLVDNMSSNVDMLMDGFQSIDLRATTDEGLMPAKKVDTPNGSSLTHEMVAPSVGDFNPFEEWGQPQHLPPVQPVSENANATASTDKKKIIKTEPGLAKEAIQALPAGGNVYLDVLFVPGYITRVPQSLAVEFFARVRARLYILAGEALDPFTGDALLIAAHKHWNKKDTEVFAELGGSFSCPQIVASDEPNDWVRWLRTPATLNGDAATSGEERLQKAGFTVAPAANLQDIEMSLLGKESTGPIKCLGTKFSF